MVGIPAINPRGHSFKGDCPAGGYGGASFRDHLGFASETAALFLGAFGARDRIHARTIAPIQGNHQHSSERGGRGAVIDIIELEVREAAPFVS
jgi:hypothetical protein